jgi:hypothetical protein
VLALCRQAGLVQLGHVALDGTKIKANASKHKAMSDRRMAAAEAALEATIGAWLAHTSTLGKTMLAKLPHGGAGSTRKTAEMLGFCCDTLRHEKGTKRCVSD